MKPERWDEIDRVLQSVLERAPGERRAFVNEVCAGDEQLRRGVLSVLESYERAGSFMESPAVGEGARALDVDREFTEGDFVGQYRIIRQLGRGGMGEVYLAQDTKLGRTVALKILPPELASDRQRMQRFEQEAKTASSLNHPNILTIFEVGETSSLHFIATEYIDGVTLRQHWKGASVKLHEILDIAIQIAAALDAAHEAGVIHRDIKPENVMVRRRDHIVKVLDFGLAKLMPKTLAAYPKSPASDAEAPTQVMMRTEPGLVMGTVAYMSPEQSRGLAVDARTDIWSLGVVLYEMIAGRLPFGGEDVHRQIIAIQEQELAPLSHAAEGVPEELRRIVSKALAKDADERYQTAKDLLIDLRNLRKRLELDAEIERSLSPEQREATTRAGSQSGRAGVGTMAQAAKIAAVEDERTLSSAEYIIGEIKRHRRGVMTAFAVLLTAFAAIASYLYFTRGDSVAVMPFSFVSADPKVMADPDREYLSDGITESIINSLSQLHNLKVIARNSVFRYKGKEIDAQAVGRELGVRTVLTGRIVQRGDQLTISAELIDVGDNKQVWGEKYERKISDLLTVQKEIAKKVSENLRLRLTGEEQKLANKDYTHNVEAYQLYLKGRYFWLNKRTEERLRKSIEYFNQAIEIDPNYALAYSGLADAYVVLGLFYVLPPTEAFTRAKAAATRALELDDKLAEAWASMSVVKLFYEWDWAGYEREGTRALELNPNYATAHYEYAQYFAAMGRFDEAVREARRAQELDPLSSAINTTVAWIFYFARDYDEAIERYRKVIEIDPNYFLAHRKLGVAYLQKKMNKEAIAETQKSRSLSEESVEEIAYLGYAYAVAGERSEAEQVVSELREQSQRRYVSPYLMALIYTGLDEKDQAFAWLEKAFEERSNNLIFLKVEPIFDPLRSDPRFTDVLRRMNLAP